MEYLEHRVYFLFHIKRSNLIDIINQAKNNFHDTLLYMRGTNMFYQDLLTDDNKRNPRSRADINHWVTLPFD